MNLWNTHEWPGVFLRPKNFLLYANNFSIFTKKSWLNLSLNILRIENLWRFKDNQILVILILSGL